MNNTGIATTITAIWVMNATSGAILNYENQTYFWPVASQIKPNPPVSIISGGSQVFNTTLVISSAANHYIIKVVSSRGTTAVGTYPSQQINSAAVNSLVAGGFGSLQMTFSSFTWYDYTSGPTAQGLVKGTILTLPICVQAEQIARVALIRSILLMVIRVRCSLVVTEPMEIVRAQTFLSSCQ